MKMPTSVLSVVSLGIFLVLVSSHEGTQDEHNLVQETLSGLLNNGNEAARQSKCSHRDIVIAQAQVQSQPSGLPTFLVEITTKIQRCKFLISISIVSNSALQSSSDLMYSSALLSMTLSSTGANHSLLA
ncbi:hypothetical protein NC653_017885 [Populus alba x Populus x berolinensis]|uniref:Uncharacterized protein n=1 Tax=Populus alba x Populus x berolinensis TaxID=444605 RepID=A0AAD6QRW1_9ROSI|nr:hypothetical protein NC653_017876 [Populus alba x Populus x berolinensis]KAJ6995236.1 hypothetical protein NC653_017885 [Populus alba x Populus x berolinensis]